MGSSLGFDWRLFLVRLWIFFELVFVLILGFFFVIRGLLQNG